MCFIQNRHAWGPNFYFSQDGLLKAPATLFQMFLTTENLIFDHNPKLLTIPTLQKLSTTEVDWKNVGNCSFYISYCLKLGPTHCM